MTSDPALLARALGCHRAGDLAEAERLYRKYLATAPDDAEAVHYLGVLRMQLGDAADGIALLRKAVALRPDAATYHTNLGKALADRKAWPEAVASYRRAADLAPADAAAQANLGLALAAAGELAGAEAAFQRAIALAPRDARLHHRLGLVFAEQGRMPEAEATFRAALERQPQDPAVLFDLGRLCSGRGALAEAESCFRQALAAAPDFAAAQAWLGDVRLARGDLDDAELWLGKAVALAPGDWRAWTALGQARMAAGEFFGARDCYREAIAAAPAEPLPRRHALMLALYDPTFDAEARAAEHRAFGAAMAARVGRVLPAPPNDRDPGRPLRVGWLSSDFRQHPVGRNLEPIFAARDPARFAFVCYGEIGRPDDMTEWFGARSDGWRPTRGLSDAAVAEQIRADGIDVMIYLAGRFDHNRPQVAAWRPAPLQVSFHDPATSGLAEMDYLIADPVLAPRRSAEWFSERVVRLPHFYAHPHLTEAPAIGPPPMAAAGYATFGCFNAPAKLGRPPLALWGRILERLPSARLRLRYKNLFASRRLQDRVRADVGALCRDRVDFEAADLSTADHLSLYNRIDVTLDPFPFTGSTTTFEALWMGVPVVTLCGETMAGRWSAALLRALNLDELVARTPEEYVEIALGLAADPSRLAALRASLRERLARSPVCDPAQAGRHFERLIRALWRRWCRAG